MKLKLDDLMCLYQLVDDKVNCLRISCMPNTLNSYFNQLTRLLNIIHAEILSKTRGDGNDFNKE